MYLNNAPYDTRRFRYCKGLDDLYKPCKITSKPVGIQWGHRMVFDLYKEDR